eukprot:TRINITY_DN11395_c4_g1_i1.p1 TRINITY_DN11395_c4_g1~~TRINITY_DN11395_c4_g1_i1.p1  ORF type:complete len:621 (+),score=146.95 TRINITY_DN11395_c4_g1_i1:138-2000(+)
MEDKVDVLVNAGGDVKAFGVSKDWKTVVLADSCSFKGYNLQREDAGPEGIRKSLVGSKFIPAGDINRTFLRVKANGTQTVEWNPIIQEYFATGNGMILQIWNANNTQNMRSAHFRQGGNIQAIGWNPHRVSFVIAACLNGTVVIHDVTRRETVLQCSLGSARKVRDVAFSRRSPYLVGSVLEQGQFALMDWRVGPESFRFIPDHTDAALSLDWHPSNDVLVATASQSGSITIWDIRTTERPVVKFIATPTATIKCSHPVHTIRWNPHNPDLLASCYNAHGYSLQIWDVKENKFAPRYVIGDSRFRNAYFTHVEWSPDDENLFMASTDTGFLWMADIQQYSFSRFEGANARRIVQFSPQEDMMICERTKDLQHDEFFLVKGIQRDVPDHVESGDTDRLVDGDDELSYQFIGKVKDCCVHNAFVAQKLGLGVASKTWSVLSVLCLGQCGEDPRSFSKVEKNILKKTVEHHIQHGDVQTAVYIVLVFGTVVSIDVEVGSSMFSGFIDILRRRGQHAQAAMVARYCPYPLGMDSNLSSVRVRIKEGHIPRCHVCSLPIHGLLTWCAGCQKCAHMEHARESGWCACHDADDGDDDKEEEGGSGGEEEYLEQEGVMPGEEEGMAVE